MHSLSQTELAVSTSFKQRRTILNFVKYLKEQIENLNLRKEIFLPKRGDVLIRHGNVLHEGTRMNDRARTRRSYVTHYTSLGAYPKEFQLPDAFANGSFTALNGGYVFDHPWIKDARELPSWSSPQVTV